MPEEETGEGRYTLSGWRSENGEWHDVEAGDRLPTPQDMTEIDLVTINLSPGTEHGFYRSARVFAGFDIESAATYELPPGDHEGYTLDDLAYELGHAYGFYAQ